MFAPCTLFIPLIIYCKKAGELFTNLDNQMAQLRELSMKYILFNERRFLQAGFTVRIPEDYPVWIEIHRNIGSQNQMMMMPNQMNGQNFGQLQNFGVNQMNGNGMINNNMPQPMIVQNGSMMQSYYN
jgi:hypothetical protein